MDKRYQVFISSTFRDLQDERQAVLRAVLELDHMPAGMELFPATDDGAWRLICDVIDSSDYYVLIIGGRYGSLDDTGIGFTEKEYDYALSTKKPVIPLLHKSPDNLPRDKTETVEAAWAKLKAFRTKVEARHTCVYWTNADELKARVIVGLTSTIKRAPGVGWIRADKVPTGASLEELLLLREQLASLQAKAASDLLRPPDGADDLLQGDDTFSIPYKFEVRNPVTYKSTSWKGTLTPTWDAIFGAAAPVMIEEASDGQLRQQIRNALTEIARKGLERKEKLAGMNLSGFSYSDSDISTCIVQMRALGLISESTRKRSVKDTGAYWSLTPWGDQRMVQLRALRRSPGKATQTTAASNEASSDIES